MKKILISVGVLVSLIAIRAYCVTTQAHNMGVVDLSFKSMTAAQVLISTSQAKGEMIFCSDCKSNGGQGTICVSTATTSSGFVLSTGTACK